MDFISSSIDDRSQVDAIYTDISKAFDSVNHELLLYKLRGYGFIGPVFNWIKSYLSERKQRVVWNDFFSSWCDVTSGVPQGSLLGPLLFAMFINDLPDVIKHSRVLLYADDMKIYRRISSTDDCLKLQNDLDAASIWLTNWGLRLNIGKCVTIAFSNKRKNHIEHTYYIDANILRQVSDIKDLGVTLSSDLTFSNHILKTTARANRLLGFVKRKTREFDDISAIKCLYVTLVRSVLEYSSVVWTPYQSKYIDILEKVQYKFVKYLKYKSQLRGSFTYDQLCSRFSLRTLQKRREISDLMFLHRCLSGKADAPSLVENINFRVPRIHTRLRQTFYIKKQRTDIAMHHNPVSRLCTMYNDLVSHNPEVDIFSLDITTFKKSLHNS